MIKVESTSSNVHLFQPCGYWNFDGIAEDINETLRDNVEEGDKTYCEVNGDKFLEYLCRCWTETFQEFLGEYIKVTFDKSHSPREYNFSHDEAYITLEFSEKIRDELLKIVRETERENFEKYLKEYHSSYDGYISFVPTDADGFFSEFFRHEERDDMLWMVIIEYIFFYREDRFKEFHEEFCDKVYNIYETGYDDIIEEVELII